MDVDTFFWPVIQAGVLGVKEEEKGLGRVWEAVNESFTSESVTEVVDKAAGGGEKEGMAPAGQTVGSAAGASAAEKEGKTTAKGVQVDLTSGYFGLYDAYKRMVINSPAPVRVIAASPKSNGFYGSKGLSRLIPEGYTYLESRFYRDAAAAGRSWDEATATGVRLREWERDGWTYHSKGQSVQTLFHVKCPMVYADQIGIWISPPQPQSNPFFTLIGSSNLSNRSLKYDTELSLLLMTSSPSLRKALWQEVRSLNANAKDVGEETWNEEARRVSWLAWLLIKVGVEGYL